MPVIPCPEMTTCITAGHSKRHRLTAPSSLAGLRSFLQLEAQRPEVKARQDPHCPSKIMTQPKPRRLGPPQAKSHKQTPLVRSENGAIAERWIYNMGSVVQRSGVQDLGRTVEFKLYKYRAASCNHHRVRSQIPNSDLQFPLVRLLVLNSFGRRA